MGVKGLWELFAPVGRRVSMDTISQKTLAVDVSIWLTQFLYAMKDSEGELIRNAHLLGILRRCCKLIFYNVKPIFVFDGATPELKRNTLANRRKQRNKQTLRLRRLAERILINELKTRALNLKKEKEVPTPPVIVTSNTRNQFVDLYQQYMNTVLHNTGLTKDSNETKDGSQKPPVKAFEIREEEASKVDVEEVAVQSNESDLEENCNDSCVSDEEQEITSENGEYEIPELENVDVDALASLPPNMFETVVSRIRSRERMKHREQFAKVENNPVEFSQKQLEGFLKITSTKKELVLARQASYEKQGAGGRRIASDPNKNYILLARYDVDSESEQESASVKQEEIEYPSLQITSSQCNADEGLGWANRTLATKRPAQSRIEPANLETNASDSATAKSEPNLSLNETEDSDDLEWVLCPPELEQQNSEEKHYDSVLSHTDEFETTHVDFSGTGGNEVLGSILPEKLSVGVESSSQHNLDTVSQNAICSSAKSDGSLSYNDIPIENKDVIRQISESGFSSETPSLDPYSEIFHLPEDCMEENVENDNNFLDKGNISSSEPEIGSRNDFSFDEKIADIEVSEDVSLPDENLESLFREFEKEREGLRQEWASAKNSLVTVTEEMFDEIRDMLRMLGIPFIQAPMEAESQCAYFNQVGLVEGVITEDSDVFLFGARTVFRNIFEDRKYVEQYEMNDVERYLGLTREKLVLMSLMLGSDYTPGIHGIGLVNATEIIRAFPTFDDLKEFAEWARHISIEEEKYDLDPDDPDYLKKEFFWKHRNMKKNWLVHDSFPNRRVVDAYVEPFIDTSVNQFQSQKPDMERLLEFCRNKFGWDAEKTKKLLLPVVRAYESNNQNQTRIDHYFHPIRFAKIKSKRLEITVRGITGETDEEMFVARKKEQEEKSAVQSKRKKRSLQHHNKKRRTTKSN